MTIDETSRLKSPQLLLRSPFVLLLNLCSRLFTPFTRWLDPQIYWFGPHLWRFRFEAHFRGLISSFLRVKVYPFQLVHFFVKSSSFLLGLKWSGAKPHLNPPNMVGLQLPTNSTLKRRSQTRGSWGGKGATGFGAGKGYDEGSSAAKQFSKGSLVMRTSPNYRWFVDSMVSIWWIRCQTKL